MAATSLDLSKVYRSPVFRTRSAREAQYELSRQLIDHELRWRPGEISASLHRRELNKVSVMVLQYGAEVEVTPLQFDDFALVQIPLKGAAEIECEGVNLKVSPWEIAVIPPRRTVRLNWEPGCEQLILRLPDSLLNVGQEPSAHSCKTSLSGAQEWRGSAFKIRPDISSQCMALLQHTIALIPAGDSNCLHPAWLDQFERTLAGFFYAHQPSMDVRSMSEAECHIPKPGHSPELDRLEEYVRTHLFAPLMLEDLAKAAGVPTRTLNALCHRHRGVTPMTLVRNLRLDAVHQRLLSGLPVSVTEIATYYGFGHLGRFSLYYRERFGELPRNTSRGLKEAKAHN
ncbi:AraC family transcriptional regulator [Achromobacter kerstersii]|uniref:HTH araC/xylS-type domain-containing protein n=1 Tax=Achromobacter kerstersii TaxID=1353890 RepID=A0A6S6ZA96_9BURK|nr:AraC family transcriptional regulator [Achromobacter kerstersii]CAB3665071.1 hypothetical protein LMG3441_00769 [Achromobacter kerstersii]